LEIGRNNLTDLWVLPVIQRNGVGSAILQELETYVKNHGFEELELETHAKNAAAIAFFKKHDFSISGLKSTYSASLDRSIDILQMRKLFE
jgi:ribosomal-protein-alanine N-acetyltransferase